MVVEVPFSLIIALSAVNGGAVVALMGVVVYLALRVGRLPTRQEHNELRNELKGDLGQLRTEMKEEMGQLRVEIREELAEFREEFRRSHQQIMLALVNHSHREDGRAVFTIPPEMETTPAPADD